MILALDRFPSTPYYAPPVSIIVAIISDTFLKNLNLPHFLFSIVASDSLLILLIASLIVQVMKIERCQSYLCS